MGNDWLKELRSIGVKRAVFSEQNPNGEAKLVEVEFFPLPATGFEQMDLDTMLTNAEGATDRPPPDEDGPPNIAPAMQRILNRGSVS